MPCNPGILMYSLVCANFGLMNPARALIRWYNIHKRELPWRGIHDPYRIWISEIILQQTRIAQGYAYYERFIQAFPDVKALALADPAEVLKNWEGLGYYSRARNLQAAAKTIYHEWGGVFRQDFREWEKLKGVGPYTARAIGSIAFGNPVAAIDGNVLRVASRLLADPSPIDQASTRKKFQEILDSWVQKVDAGTFNQAMMDLGASLCTPKNPSCDKCPVSEHCLAFREGCTNALPVKSKKAKRKQRHFHFYLVRNAKGQFLIRQRPKDKGIWAGLWEIPNAEIQANDFETASPGWKEETRLKHVFTHFDMHIRVLGRKLRTGEASPFEGQFIHPSEIAIFAFSRAVLKIFEACVNEYIPNPNGKIRPE